MPRVNSTRLKSLIFIAIVTPLISCSVADLVRRVRNVDLETQGIVVKLSWTPPGMYEKPFMIEFDSLLNEISNGAINIHSYNIYTVENYDKQPGISISGVTNFLDPNSRIKDAWFGLYVIIDDSAGENGPGAA